MAKDMKPKFEKTERQIVIEWFAETKAEFQLQVSKKSPWPSRKSWHGVLVTMKLANDIFRTSNTQHHPTLPDAILNSKMERRAALILERASLVWTPAPLNEVCDRSLTVDQTWEIIETCHFGMPDSGCVFCVDHDIFITRASLSNWTTVIAGHIWNLTRETCFRPRDSTFGDTKAETVFLVVRPTLQWIGWRLSDNMVYDTYGEYAAGSNVVVIGTFPQ